MEITHLDHLVLTVTDINTTLAFYNQVLGMDIHQYGEGRFALQFGNQKINLHQYGKEFLPKAKFPIPGSADLCFITKTPLHRVIQELQEHAIDVFEGPVERMGASGTMLSVYFRDPDQNLIEISNYI
ncbi:glyoxalase [Flavobacterium rivuli WB 3.3-2 = DSM 21788]|uniref:Glyoxalase n=1 Tax=Flavobacterium rivuli WB 3.3-2 = DSM 21788 TaxID=1121895 RepID=A0A0A2M8U1_9FLAO|nr:VOC family protein [Flavobacterium rivuli]KGO84690.1 glyoxalase [Flavobacterium rivuli WB 3.3-2 = DSM 21788]